MADSKGNGCRPKKNPANSSGWESAKGSGAGSGVESQKPKRLDLHEVEEKWRKYWEREGIYRFDAEAKGSVFSLDTPPPTVSGKMHLGHAFSYTQADVIARYKKMRGFNLFYPFGFDDNGLATERMVERARGIRSKDFTRQEFIKICLEETKKAEERMRQDFGMLGLACDWSLAYRTIDALARKAAQRSFIDIYEKGRAYQREAPTMWCPKCETAIAQAELEDMEQEADFYYIKFNVKAPAGAKEAKGQTITIATTRPELMPACVAIHVNPDDKRYRNLAGREVEVPFAGRTVKIWANPKVAMDFGTGAVYHCTFGDLDDVEWVMEYNMPVIEIVGRDGILNERAGQFKGLHISEARGKVAGELKKAGHLEKVERIQNVVNVHERCKTPVEILTTKQWFVKYLDLKGEFIARGEQINWHPKHMRVRYNHWVNGLKWDWCISRQRFFGVPFPVWYCRKCGKVALADERQLPVDPLQDKPKGKCKCGCVEFEPERDVFDTWFTSSLTPQIAAGWKEDEKRFKKLFPMSMRPQAHDIINLWAFYTIVKGLMHEGKLPWKDVMISGHALDPKGRKMSKSLGNVIEPVVMVGKYSTDILRYWSCAGTLGEDMPFQEKEMVAGQKFMTKLYNAGRFVANLAKGAGLQKTSAKKSGFMPSDLWILSRLNSVKKEATDALEKYEFSRAQHAIRDFFWLEFADFYIEEAKWRAYGSGSPAGEAAKFTLLTVFSGTLKMLAPFLPHITEEIYREILGGRKKSIHLEEWPEAEDEWLDKDAEETGILMNLVISEVRKWKSASNLALNSETGKVLVTVNEEGLKRKIEACSEEIRKTMNIRVLGVVVEGGQGERVKVGAEL